MGEPGLAGQHCRHGSANSDRHQRRSRPARPRAQPLLFGAAGADGVLRQAVRHHARPAGRSKPRHRVRMVRRPAGAHHQVTARPEIRRRRGAGRRGGEVQFRAQSQPARLAASDRADLPEVRRGDRRHHGTAQPQGTAGAAALHPRRPCRHDDLAQGGQGAWRKVRQRPGLRRSVQVRQPRRAIPHHLRGVRRATGTAPTSISTGWSSRR